MAKQIQGMLSTEISKNNLLGIIRRLKMPKNIVLDMILWRLYWLGKFPINLQLPFGKSMVMRPSTFLRIGHILPCSRSNNGSLTLIVKLVMRIAGPAPGYLLSFVTHAHKTSKMVLRTRSRHWSRFRRVAQRIFI